MNFDERVSALLLYKFIGHFIWIILIEADGNCMSKYGMSCNSLKSDFKVCCF